MRDVLLSALILGSLPVILWRPYIGVLMWVWISMMNPHRLSYGFAYSFPFAMLVAATTLLAFLVTKRKQPFPVTPVTAILVCFFLWMCVTRIFALNSDEAVNELWLRVFKTQLMLWVTLMLVSGRDQIRYLVWALVVSIGFFGVKGGVWTLLTGGNHRVWGPPGTYIEGNNELALALVILIPLMYWLYALSAEKRIRYGLLFAMVASAFSILGSHSRGALLAIVAMASFMALKSEKPIRAFITVGVLALVLLAFMPEHWWSRMDTIANYQGEGSAEARLHTWRMIWSLALDRPIFGAGFDLANPLLYQIYAEDPIARSHAAHSIYFQALGEHGFVGLLLYLALGVISWVTASRVARVAEGLATLNWAVLLMRMVQVSMIGFAAGGAFLGLLHFDLPYYLLALIVIVQREVNEHLESRPTAVESK